MRFYIKEKKDQPNPKTVFPNAFSIINYAFTIDEKDFFEFDDFNNVPCERGFNALTIYNELSQRCSRDYLIAFSTALDNIVNDNRGIRLTEVVKLNLQLKERLELITEVDIAYKLCAVVYFDSAENPYKFEYKRAMENADLFNKCDMNEFFFSQPIKKLMPSIASFGKDLRDYLEIITKMNKKHLADISMMLSDNDKSNEYFKSLELLLKKELQ